MLDAQNVILYWLCDGSLEWSQCMLQMTGKSTSQLCFWCEMFTTPAVWKRKLNINISDAAHMFEGSHTPNARFLKNLRLKFNGFRQHFPARQKFRTPHCFLGSFRDDGLSSSIIDSAADIPANQPRRAARRRSRSRSPNILPATTPERIRFRNRWMISYSAKKASEYD